MNTSGHHSVAREAGEVVLQNALKAVNKEHLSTTAFYMGNWLADVSQAVDPVAYENAAGKIKGLIQDSLERVVQSSSFRNTSSILKKDFAENINKTRDEVFSAIDDWLMSKTDDPRECELGLAA